MIQDAELRDLFRVESAEHLDALEENLLRLEKNPQDQVLIETGLRTAHTLKGASQMVDLSDLVSLAHRFEDLLGAAKRGQPALTVEMVDRLYGDLDAMRRIARS